MWLVVGWLVWVAGGYMKCTLGMVGLVSIALAMAADADAAILALVAARDVSS